MDNICQAREEHTGFICIAFTAFLQSHGEIKSKTVKSSHALAFPLCTTQTTLAWIHPLNERWSMVNLHLARGPLATHSYTTKTPASSTWEHLALTTSNGRALQLAVVGGDAFSGISSERERRGSLA